MDGKYCCLHLKVKAETKFGQTVCVAGSSVAMGKYSLSEVVPLVTTPEQYPIWTTQKPIVVPRSATKHHTYLYCIQEGGKFKEWESEMGLRRVVADTSSKLLEDTLGSVPSLEHLHSMGEEDHHTASPALGKSTPREGSNVSEGDEGGSLVRKALQLPPAQSPPLRQANASSEEVSQDGSSVARERSWPAARNDGASAVFENHRGAVLYLVCFHLPVKMRKTPEGKWQAEWAESLIAKSRETISEYLETRWIGTISVPDEDLLTEDEKREIIAVLAELKCTPVFIPKYMRDGHYHGFCKQVLWPAFHNVDILDLASCVWMEGTMEAGQMGTGDASSSSTSTSPQPPSESAPSPSPVPPTPGSPGRDLGDLAGEAWDQSSYSTWWGVYKSVNKMFAQQVQPLLQENDVVWIHDYHLMLLPKLLSDMERAIHKRRRINMVFFLHIPFPTSQIFRSLFCGPALLQGMLNANVVGFHSFDHARHFLNACKRLLGLSYQSRQGGLMGVEYKGRTVMVVMSHVGIEPLVLDDALGGDEFQRATEELQKKFQNKKVICGLDVLQRLSGVTLKLMAFEKLLEESPIYRDQVVLVQWCLRPGSRLKDEERSSNEAKAVVERIQQKFGPNQVVYEELTNKNAPLHQRLALWTTAQVFVTSAVRDGLNLWPLEYIYAKRGREPGVVLASEFSACGCLLNGALRINPFDVASVAATMDQALSMAELERTGRMSRDLPYICSRNAALWTRQVLADMWTLAGTNAKDLQAEAELSPDAAKQRKKRLSQVTALEESSMNKTFGGHEMTMVGFEKLSNALVKAAYQQTQRRVFLFDYGGTLVETEGLGKYVKRQASVLLQDDPQVALAKGQKRRKPIIDLVKQLASDPNNTVFVISAVQRERLAKVFRSCPEVGLAASNGMTYTWPGDSPESASGEQQTLRSSMVEGGGESTQIAEGRVWTKFDYGIDWDEVKDVALPILNRITAHTNGSVVQLQEAGGISWSHFNADPEWGQIMAKQLLGELEEALQPLDVSAQRMGSSVEIMPRRLHKGVVVRRILSDQLQYRGGGGMPDFVLCIGDDASDEFMYTSVNAFLADHALPHGEEEESAVKFAFTCAVGLKPSHANMYVDSVDDVESLVRDLVAISNSA